MSTEKQNFLLSEEPLYDLIYSMINDSTPFEYTQTSDKCWYIKINPNLVLWNYLNGKYDIVLFNKHHVVLTNEHKKNLWELATKVYSTQYDYKRIKTLVNRIKPINYSK